MAPKREKEETELKVRPSPPLRSSIQHPPRLDRSSRTKRFDRRLEITPPPPTPTRRRQQTAAAERKKVNRCSGCWRKVGLTRFRCRCGDLFCSEHRYSGFKAVKVRARRGMPVAFADFEDVLSKLIQEKINGGQLVDIKPMKGDSKYLGLPTFWGRSKVEAYTFLIEKAMGKMQGWKNKLISMGGKGILVKSVVQGIPTFAMACFLSLGLCLFVLVISVELSLIGQGY
ncbi:hypothetical protein RHMOL_Rhmol02G0255400 [Rhododendron molle]|uniref:Uncharacterized protein n=2 Tax=Rhododendron molle TaxID=49168 RepID=A0ACC0PTV6_RHOML|nr:hypothetical protein RHMOL_Rhmol02G0255400 [Rhododendron molle]